MANLKSFIVRAGALAFAAFALASCGALDSTATEVDAAFLQFQGTTATMSVPDTVTHGVFFVLSFNTFGGGCTNEVAGDDVSITGNEVDVSPTNRTVASGSCGTDIIDLPHSVNLSVPTAGTWTIKVTGLTDAAPSGSASNLFSIQKTITAK